MPVASASLLWSLQKITRLLCDCICAGGIVFITSPSGFKRSIFVASACVVGPRHCLRENSAPFFHSECLVDCFPSWATVQVCKLKGQHSVSVSGSLGLCHMCLLLDFVCVCTTRGKCENCFHFPWRPHGEAGVTVGPGFYPGPGHMNRTLQETAVSAGGSLRADVSLMPVSASPVLSLLLLVFLFFLCFKTLLALEGRNINCANFFKSFY